MSTRFTLRKPKKNFPNEYYLTEYILAKKELVIKGCRFESQTAKGVPEYIFNFKEQLEHPWNRLLDINILKIKDIVLSIEKSKVVSSLLSTGSRPVSLFLDNCSFSVDSLRFLFEKKIPINSLRIILRSNDEIKSLDWSNFVLNAGVSEDLTTLSMHNANLSNTQNTLLKYGFRRFFSSLDTLLLSKCHIPALVFREISRSLIFRYSNLSVLRLYRIKSDISQKDFDKFTAVLLKTEKYSPKIRNITFEMRSMSVYSFKNICDISLISPVLERIKLTCQNYTHLIKEVLSLSLIRRKLNSKIHIQLRFQDLKSIGLNQDIFKKKWRRVLKHDKTIRLHWK
eukprot:snap_masked-scaffold_34-processed-gene-2.22-mRNA-1 protein AED:1.00 eAED:1.00 QI:0/-1/0/0/-1/1/1/0/339